MLEYLIVGKVNYGSFRLGFSALFMTVPKKVVQKKHLPKKE
jgi:hypothetical protein